MKAHSAFTKWTRVQTADDSEKLLCMFMKENVLHRPGPKWDMIMQYVHTPIEYGSCMSINKYTAHLISRWIHLHCFNFIKGLMQFITFLVSSHLMAVMAPVPAIRGWRRSCRWERGFIPGSPHPNECIIRLWFPGLRQTPGNNLLLRCLFPKCLLPSLTLPLYLLLFICRVHAVHMLP